MQVLPLCPEPAVAVEHLHAVVLALGGIDPAVGVAEDVVNDVNSPSPDDIKSLPSGGVFVDARIAVAIRDANVLRSLIEMPCLLKAMRPAATAAGRVLIVVVGQLELKWGGALGARCATRPRFPPCSACELAPAAAGGCWITTVRWKILAGNGMTGAG